MKDQYFNGNYLEPKCARCQYHPINCATKATGGPESSAQICPVCYGTAMSSIWRFCPECGRILTFSGK